MRIQSRVLLSQFISDDGYITRDRLRILCGYDISTFNKALNVLFNGDYVVEEDGYIQKTERGVQKTDEIIAKHNC